LENEQFIIKSRKGRSEEKEEEESESEGAKREKEERDEERRLTTVCQFDNPMD